MGRAEARAPSELRRHRVGNIWFHNLGDVWFSEVGYFDRSNRGNFDQVGMIADSEEKVEDYLRTISSLWWLGVKKFDPFQHSPQAISCHLEEERRQREWRNKEFKESLEKPNL